MFGSAQLNLKFDFDFASLLVLSLLEKSPSDRVTATPFQYIQVFSNIIEWKRIFVLRELTRMLSHSLLFFAIRSVLRRHRVLEEGLEVASRVLCSCYCVYNWTREVLHRTCWLQCRLRREESLQLSSTFEPIARTWFGPGCATSGGMLPTIKIKRKNRFKNSMKQTSISWNNSHYFANSPSG